MSNIFQTLEEMGIEHHSLDSKNQGKLIYKIRLPWTVGEKVDIISIEGELFPACCANISDARDIFIDALRQDGWISLEDLDKACQYIINCIGTEFAFDEGDEESYLSEPIQKIFRIQKLTKEVSEYPAKLHSYKNNNAEDAISNVSRMSHFLWMQDFFGNTDNEDYKKLCKIWGRARLFPALRLLMDNLEKNEEVLNGLIILHPNGEIVETLGGPAIYPDQKMVDMLFDHWGKEACKDLIVKPIEISVKNAIIYKD